jgi:hypothetical protein
MKEAATSPHQLRRDADMDSPQDHPDDDLDSTRSQPARPPSKAGPFTGGFYWFPTPTTGPTASANWSVVTSRDLGCDPDAGHDAELWPLLLDLLADAWGRDRKSFRRRLRQYYTGLSSGRVTKPARTFLVLHGDDAPISGWRDLVVEKYRLGSSKFTMLFVEHETQIPGHPEALAATMGFPWWPASPRTNPDGA